MSRDLLKEAIADAKAVKETAIANAKAYLEEAFTPQLRSMLAAKLEEMDEETNVEESETTNETTDVKEEMTDPDMRHGEDEDGEPEEGALKQTEKDREITEEELDLDEILAELENEDNSEITEEDESRAERADVDKYEYEKGKEAGEDEEEEGEEEEEDVEIDLEDMTEDDLKSFIETVIADMVEAGELEAGEEIEDEDSEIEIADIEVEDEIEIAEAEVTEDARTDAEQEGYKDGWKDALKKVKNALKGMKGDVSEDFLAEFDELGFDMEGTGHNSNWVSPVDRQTFQENKKFKSDLQEAYDTIKTLKSELNEINLLNAKLLYTNKIFRSKNLTEQQKVKILNAFDKAGTVKEVKIVFETLSENIKVKRTKDNLKESLGFASKPTGVAKTEIKPVVETDPMVERFKKLAGIK